MKIGFLIFIGLNDLGIKESSPNSVLLQWSSNPIIGRSARRNFLDARKHDLGVTGTFSEDLFILILKKSWYEETHIGTLIFKYSASSLYRFRTVTSVTCAISAISRCVRRSPSLSVAM